MHMVLSALMVLQGSFARTSTAQPHLVWPPPQEISAVGPPISLHPQFAATSSSTFRRLAAALARHAKTTIGPAVAAANSSGGLLYGHDRNLLRELELVVDSPDESLGMATDYSYNLTTRAATATSAASAQVRCASIYGCMYGLETFAQLLDTQRGAVLHSQVDIVDVRTANFECVSLNLSFCGNMISWPDQSKMQ